MIEFLKSKIGERVSIKSPADFDPQIGVLKAVDDVGLVIHWERGTAIFVLCLPWGAVERLLFVK